MPCGGKRDSAHGRIVSVQSTVLPRARVFLYRRDAQNQPESPIDLSDVKEYEEDQQNGLKLNIC